MHGRVLVECDVPLPAMDRTEILETAGFTVDRCCGPGCGPCPVLSGQRCAAVGDADVVVNALSAGTLEVATATAVVHPDVPRVTLLSPGLAEDVSAVLRMGTVVPNDLDDRALVAAVLGSWSPHREGSS